MKTTKKKFKLKNSCLLSKGKLWVYVLAYCSKKNRQYKYIFGFLFGIIFLIAFSDKPEELTSNYSVHILGAEVGEFSVTQTRNDGNITINAITDIKANLLISYRIKYIQNTVYAQGVLQNSHIETYKNGKLSSSMWLKFKNGSYLLINDGDTTIINDSITYSGSLLYFNEPKGIKQIFKERSAEMRGITPLNEHTYIIKDEKERELNRYYYEEGILQHATMRNTLGNLVLKRI